MKKLFFLLMLISSLLIFFLFTKVFAEDPNNQNNIIVGFTSDKTKDAVAEELTIDPQQIKEIPQIEAFRIKHPSSWQKAKIYAQKFFTKKIKYIEPDYQYRALIVPNDPYYPSQWNLTKISAASAWSKSTGSNTTKIAIVDTGINGIHQDLLGKVIAGHAYLYSGGLDYPIEADSESDDYGHGSVVAGAAAAIGNNSQGIAGIDWQAKIMPVKVLDFTGTGYASDVAAGIIYAADNGAKVINLSLGGQYPSSAVENAVNYAHDTKGSVVVAASGNDNSSISYPARYENVIAVGGTDQEDNRCLPGSCGYGSNYGPELDVAAPGTEVYGTTMDGGYAQYGGTSLAAPQVSGLAALLLAYDSLLSNSEIETRIKDNADKVAAMGGSNFTDEYGYGRINNYQSLLSSPSNDPTRYHCQYVSQNSYPALAAGQGYNFIVQFRNTGTTTWYKSVVHFGTDRSQDRTPSFIRADLADPYGHPSHWISPNRVEMSEESVAPGETATFSFWMSAPNSMPAGTYQEYFRLVADNITWMEDYGIYWNITVNSLAQAYYPTQWVSQNAYPTLDQSQGYNFIVNVQNTGTATWQRGTVNLGTNQPQDRTPVFLRADINDLYGHPSNWISPNRVQMQQSSVAAGETATFSFWMSTTANTPPGTYREYFRLVAEGITWMQDRGIYWDIQVN